MGSAEPLIPTGWRGTRGFRWALGLRHPPAASRGGFQERFVRVKGEYLPAEVHVKAGMPVRLVFRREETAPCSERVVFPDYGISASLPPFQNVVIDLPASEAGTHRFCCDMDMLHGDLIVEANGASPATTREAA